MLTNRHRLHSKAVHKREAKKDRPVISADDYIYIKMDYVSQWLEKALQGNELSVLFLKGRQAADFWLQASQACRRDTLKVPLDQSNFDHQVNSDMWDTIITCIRETIEMRCTWANKGELLSVLELIRTGVVEGGTVRVDMQDGSHEVRARSGMLSGLRWTSLADTLVNFGELYSVHKSLERLGFEEPFDFTGITKPNCFGDDDYIELRDWGLACAVPITYNYTGGTNLPVHPGKFFIRKGVNEFLRKVITSEVICGYYWRSMLSICWRNPISVEPVAGDIRLGEQLQRWNTMLARGGFPSRVMSCMLRDMCGGNGLSKIEVKKLLGTPRSVGGLGYVVNYTDWVKSIPAKVDRHVVLEKIPRGLQEYLKDLRPTRGEWTEAVISRVTIPEKFDIVEPFRIADIDTITPYFPSSIPAGISRVAKKNVGMDGLRGDILYRRAVQSKDWSWIEDVYIDPSERDMSHVLRKKARRSIWLKWVEGKLPYSIPMSPGWSESFISNLYSDVLDGFWLRLCSVRHITHKKLLRSAVSAEYAVRRLADEIPVRVAD
jgi:hypothetical protein